MNPWHAAAVAVRLRSCCILIATVCLAAAVARGADPERPPNAAVGPGGKSLKIGALDVTAVLAKYKRVEDLQKKTIELFGARFEEIRRRLRELQQTRRDLETTPFSRDAPQFKQMVEKHEADKKAYVADKERLLRSADEHKYKQTQLLSADFIEAVRIHAEAEGFDLILKRSDQRAAPGEPVDIVLTVRLNSVLFASSAVDISDRIAKRLNEAYEKGEPLGKPLLDRLRMQRAKIRRRRKPGADVAAPRPGATAPKQAATAPRQAAPDVRPRADSGKE